MLRPRLLVEVRAAVAQLEYGLHVAVTAFASHRQISIRLARAREILALLDKSRLA